MTWRNNDEGGIATEKKGFSFTTLLAAVFAAALIMVWAVYFIQQQSCQREQQGLTNQVTALQAQVAEMEKELDEAHARIVPAEGRELRSLIQEKGDLVLLALKNKDAAGLTRLVHPQQGLRFTPYTYINPATDLVFPAAELPALFSSTSAYTWGSYDGSGEPINLAFNAYYGRFIYDQDFMAAPQIVFNQVLQRGNMINNFTDVYPQAVSLEYHFPGFNAQYEGMDWESLKLVFEQSGNEWYLVGIIHEQWTI